MKLNNKIPAQYFGNLFTHTLQTRTFIHTAIRLVNKSKIWSEVVGKRSTYLKCYFISTALPSFLAFV